MAESYLYLEASEHVDQEWMSHGVCHLEDAFLGQERLDLVPGDDVALLQGLDGEVLAGVLVLGQNDLKQKNSSLPTLFSTLLTCVGLNIRCLRLPFATSICNGNTAWSYDQHRRKAQLVIR